VRAALETHNENGRALQHPPWRCTMKPWADDSFLDGFVLKLSTLASKKAFATCAALEAHGDNGRAPQHPPRRFTPAGEIPSSMSSLALLVLHLRLDCAPCEAKLVRLLPGDVTPPLSRRGAASMAATDDRGDLADVAVDVLGVLSAPEINDLGDLRPNSPTDASSRAAAVASPTSSTSASKLADILRSFL